MNQTAGEHVRSPGRRCAPRRKSPNALRLEFENGGTVESAARFLCRQGTVDRADPLVELVARKIIKLGQQGERDPKRIRDLAVIAFTTRHRCRPRAIPA